MPSDELDPSRISDAAPATARSHKKKKKPAPSVAKQRLRDLEAKTAPPAKPRVTAAPRTPLATKLRKGLEDLPSIDILERRLLNPEGTPSEPIQLRGQTEPMELHWINTDIPGRYHEVTRYGGWIPVTTRELRDKNEVSDLQESPDGYVTRGDRGREVLMKMPKRWYDAIKRKQAQIEIRRLSSSARLKADVQEAAAGQSHTFKDHEGNTQTISGDEAAAGVGKFFGDINVSRETIQFEPAQE